MIIFKPRFPSSIRFLVILKVGFLKHLYDKTSEYPYYWCAMSPSTPGRSPRSDLKLRVEDQFLTHRNFFNKLEKHGCKRVYISFFLFLSHGCSLPTTFLISIILRFVDLIIIYGLRTRIHWQTVIVKIPLGLK